MAIHVKTKQFAVIDLTPFKRWALGILIAWGAWLGLATAVAAPLAVPKLTGWVVDEAQVLTPAQRTALDQMLQQFEQQKGAQIFILTLPTLAGEPIERFAVRVFEAWGVGRKGVDDGVLLVAAIEDRKLRIEVGYGLEGAIPDIVAGRIIREQIAPAFQQQAYAQGLMAAATQLMLHIEGEALPVPEEGDSAEDRPEGIEIVIIVAILFGFSFLVPPVPAAVAVGLFIFVLFEAVGWAIGAAMGAFLLSSLGSVWRFGPDSDTRYATGSRSARRRHHDHWGGGGFGGGGMGGGIGGGGASGGGGSSGGGGASGGW